MTGHADVVHGGAGAPEGAEPQTDVSEIQARQMMAKGPKTTQTTGSSVVVDDSAGAPMRAKGPKRPNRKLMSIKFKQDE